MESKSEMMRFLQERQEARSSSLQKILRAPRSSASQRGLRFRRLQVEEEEVFTPKKFISESEKIKAPPTISRSDRRKANHVALSRLLTKVRYVSETMKDIIIWDTIVMSYNSNLLIKTEKVKPSNGSSGPLVVASCRPECVVLLFAGPVARSQSNHHPCQIRRQNIPIIFDIG